MPFFEFLDDSASMVDLWRRNPDRMLAISQYTEQVMRTPSPLSRGERELIAAYVSGLNQCRYCHGTHTAFAEAHGLDPDMLKAILDDLEGAPVGRKLMALLSYCKKLTETPSRLTLADAQAVKDAGWPEAALEDAVHVTALFNYYNRLMDGHGITPRGDDTLRQRAAFIKQHGYDFSTYPSDMHPANLGEKDGR